MGGPARYTRGEVIYLLSLSRTDAIEADARFADSCASIARRDAEGDAATSHEEWDPVFTIARWRDVHGARARVVRDKLEATVVQLRVAGYTEEEVARISGLTRSTARRRFRATVAEILEELGGEDEPLERVSIVSACLLCGERPRARVAGRRRRARDPQRRMVPERQSSLCVDCTPPERRVLLVGA